MSAGAFQPLSATYLRDPLAGFDLNVSVSAYQSSGGTSEPLLQGAFTGFMCRITDHTEAYLVLNSRVPRMLGGELTVEWHLEQGQIMDQAVTNAFGKTVSLGLQSTRGMNAAGANAIPRTKRFAITLECPTQNNITVGEDQFAWDSADATGINLKLVLSYARIDTGSYGVVAGKRTANSAWVGTAEFISVGSAS